MCGITGYVRTGSRTIFVKKVMTNLMCGIEERGAHAAGFAIMDKTGAGVIHKAPIKASVMAHSGQWEWAWKKFKPDVFLGHARFAVYGDPKKNINNHPHSTKNGDLVLIHNGVIRDGKNIKIVSECDTERALRLIEKKGIVEAFHTMCSWRNSGFAILVLDRKAKKLWAFRNDRNPLWIANAKLACGGLLFASTQDILRRALTKSGLDPADMEMRSLKADTLYCFDTSSTWDAEEYEPLPARLPDAAAWYWRRVTRKTTCPCGSGRNWTPWKERWNDTLHLVFRQ